MPPAYRIAEICLYSILNFLPFLILALYPFRHRLRFSKPITWSLIAVLTVIQLWLGLWAAFFSNGRAGLVSAVSTALYTAFFFLSVKVSFGKALFTLLMVSNAANLAVVASKSLEGVFFPSLALEVYRWSFSLVTFLVETAILIPLFLYVKKVYTPAVEKEPSGFEWRYLWLIPATFYLLWYYEIYANPSQSSLKVALQPKNAIFLFFINVGANLVYFIVARLISEQEKNINLSEKNHLLALQELQYENLRERILEARRAKHDVRHHIALMQELLKKKDYSGLESYLSDYQKSLPEDTPFVFCENSAANAVLSYFAQLSKSRGIEYDISTKIPEEIGIEKTDLSVLLGNLLENAVDACAEIEKAKISVRASYELKSLCLTVDNSFDGKLRKNKNGSFSSTKKNGQGLGTQSVKSIAEKYGGVCDFETDGKIFSASVMLGERQE